MLKLYVFSVLFIAMVGFAAYFFGTYTPNFEARPKPISDTKSEEQFTAINLDNNSGNTTTAAIETPAIPVQTDNTSAPTVEDVTEVVPLSDIPVETEFGNDHQLYKSKLNKRVSFLIPANSKVDETGSVTNIKFVIESPNTKRYIMTYAKVQEGCYDALGSFSIGSGQGIDFRIIQDNKEIVLDNKLNALRLHEMYGSYAGSVGFRGNACIQTAVPTRVEIRASGFGRYEGADAYGNFDKILQSLTV